MLVLYAAKPIKKITTQQDRLFLSPSIAICICGDNQRSVSMTDLTLTMKEEKRIEIIQKVFR